jgi:hypothetical protein
MATLLRSAPLRARIPAPLTGTVSRAVTGAAAPVRRVLADPGAVPAALAPLAARPPRRDAGGNHGTAVAAPARRRAGRHAGGHRRARPVRHLLAVPHRLARHAGADGARSGGPGSRWSAMSAFSLLCFGSGASVGSALSLFSAGSLLSVGSAGSILSIGSAGSILSIGSAGSILSVGCAGSILSIGEDGRIGGDGRADGRTSPPRLLHGTATVLGATALLAAAVGR